MRGTRDRHLSERVRCLAAACLVREVLSVEVFDTSPSSLSYGERGVPGLLLLGSDESLSGEVDTGEKCLTTSGHDLVTCKDMGSNLWPESDVSVSGIPFLVALSSCKDDTSNGGSGDEISLSGTPFLIESCVLGLHAAVCTVLCKACSRCGEFDVPLIRSASTKLLRV